MKSFFSSRRCQVTGLNGVTFLDRTRMVADPPGSPPQAPAYQVVQGCIFSWKIIPLEKNFFPSSSVNIFEEINRGNKYFFFVGNKYLCNKYKKGFWKINGFSWKKTSNLLVEVEFFFIFLRRSSLWNGSGGGVTVFLPATRYKLNSWQYILFSYFEELFLRNVVR